jgi:hypothetical protein
LALLRCAEILEMQVAGDFPLCPPEARLDLLPSPFPDLFVQLDQLSAQASPG